MRSQRYLIFTDLDGTLLDHDTYSFEAALETLNKLHLQGHFVMPCTSKTLEEVVQIRDEIGITTPFIVENGAALVVPKDFFPSLPPGMTEVEDYYFKSFTKNSDHWVSLLNQHASNFDDLYQGFSQMSLQQIVQYTGLSEDAAELASKRRFGEPVKWFGDEQSKAEFVATMTAAGANILHGGRFMHVSGDCDKGSALIATTQLFERICGDYDFTSIALGDSGNDIAMLEAADIAVLIKSPAHPFPTITKTQNIYLSTQYGPKGWAEILEQLIFST